MIRYLSVLLIFLGLLVGQRTNHSRANYRSTTMDQYDKYSSVGQLGLTITNFGILGNGWNKMEDGSIHPSCQYKQYTEIKREQVEHFSYADLNDFLKNR